MRMLAIVADPSGRLAEVWTSDEEDVARADAHQAQSGIAPQHRVHVAGPSMLPILPALAERIRRVGDWGTET